MAERNSIIEIELHNLSPGKTQTFCEVNPIRSGEVVSVYEDCGKNCRNVGCLAWDSQIVEDERGTKIIRHYRRVKPAYGQSCFDPEIA